VFLLSLLAGESSRTRIATRFDWLREPNRAPVASPPVESQVKEKLSRAMAAFEKARQFGSIARLAVAPNVRTVLTRFGDEWNRPLQLLRHLLRLAREEWEVLATVPKILMEREPRGLPRWLKPEDAVRLLAACGKSRNPALADLVEFALLPVSVRAKH